MENRDTGSEHQDALVSALCRHLWLDILLHA